MRWACCALWMVSSRAPAPLRMCDSSISPYLTRNAFIPIRDERVVRGATQIKLLETKKSPMMHSGKSQLHSFRVQPIMENNDLYPSPITGAFRQRLLVWFRYGAYAPPAQPTAKRWGMVEPLRPEVTLGVRAGAVWAFVFGQCPLPVAGGAAPRI